ncbi:hypothetical protein E4T43_08193 [Aureobasidium subglaciale]|nr:hypothetical protein E4T43_08193 [Aureobasidium subglaciale]
MVRISAFVTAAFASVAIASPAERRQTASSSSDLVCGGLLQPLAGFLDYQSGNVGGNTENVLAAASSLLSKAQLPSEVNSILNSVTGGIVGSITNGVTNILYGLSTAADAVDPECRQNAAYCTNELSAASAACAAGQPRMLAFKPNTPVNGIAPCCSQYTGSAASP